MTQPTKLKIWCEECNGSGEVAVDDNLFVMEQCRNCQGLGYTEQSVEPLEVKVGFSEDSTRSHRLV